MKAVETKDQINSRSIVAPISNKPALLVMFLLSISGCNLIGYAQTKQGSNMGSNTVITYKTVDVNGLEIFYREAGDPSKPTILLLHGFPSSSHMYRDLIPKLADQFHLVAPDYPGSGNSRWQEYLKKHQPKILVVWGKNDQIFLPPGAEAFKRDVPKTEIHFYDTGHFALEEESVDIAKQIKNVYR